MGEMHRAIAREQEEERRKRDRFASTIVIAASIIAAVRLARDDISRPSPRLTSTVADRRRACADDPSESHALIVGDEVEIGPTQIIKFVAVGPSGLPSVREAARRVDREPSACPRSSDIHKRRTWWIRRRDAVSLSV